MSDNHNEKLKEARANAETMAKAKLNLHSPELQERLMNYVSSFLEQKTTYVLGSGERIDYMKYGMIAEILSKTPCRIYDLPELKSRVDTAFVDTTGRMYIADTFFLLLEEEQKKGHESMFFIFIHEMEHNRRMHTQRMLEYPSDIANYAQDIRINCDTIQLLAWDTFIEDNGRPPKDNELLTAIKDKYDTLGPEIKLGCATDNFSEYEKWNGRSEESIAAELYKEQKNKKQKKEEEQEISFPMLCEGVAQDFDRMANIAGKNCKNAADYLSASTLSREIGLSKGKTTLQKVRDLIDLINVGLSSVEMTKRNIEHTTIAQKAVLANLPTKSVNSGDTYIDALYPNERLSSLKQVLSLILQPSNSNNGEEQKSDSKIKIKDLDLPRSNPKSSQKNKSSQNNPNSSGQSPSVYDGDEHVMTAQELADILTKAGVHDAIKVLGYDDLEKIENEEKSAKTNITSAINKASMDQVKLGSVYPGGHLLEYASDRMREFFKPILSWKMATIQIMEEIGKKSRFEHDEPWAQYYSSAEDQGLSSEDDIGYMGSHVMGGTTRPLLIHIIDSSGSVGDDLLTRFTTDAVYSARDMGQGENSPEVIVIFADTIARGAPVLINEDNFEDYLKNGLPFGGRGGTNFTASVQNVFKMLTIDNHEDSELSKYRGRKIDAMVYFTDTFDAPPDQDAIEKTAFECGMNQLPTMLFLAPSECYSDSFKDGVKNYADCIFFDTNELEIDMVNVESNIRERGMRKTN